MKRIITLLILLTMALALMIAFSACGEKKVVSDVTEHALATTPPKEASGNEITDTLAPQANSTPSESTPVSTTVKDEDYKNFIAADLQVTANGNQLNIHNNFGDDSTQYAWYVSEGDLTNPIHKQGYTNSPDFSFTFENLDSTYFITAFVRKGENDDIKKAVFIYDIYFSNGIPNFEIIDYRKFSIADVEYEVDGNRITAINHFGNKHTVYAWYIYEGSPTNKIDQVWYSYSPKLEYSVPNKDSKYFIRAYCRDENDKELPFSVITDEIIIP
jgi:hypothetical protein